MAWVKEINCFLSLTLIPLSSYSFAVGDLTTLILLHSQFFSLFISEISLVQLCVSLYWALSVLFPVHMTASYIGNVTSSLAWHLCVSVCEHNPLLIINLVRIWKRLTVECVLINHGLLRWFTPCKKRKEKEGLSFSCSPVNPPFVNGRKKLFRN